MSKVPSVPSTQGLGERPSERLRAAQEGDRASLEQLVENRRAELLSIAINQLDSDVRVKESPSDLVQESLIEGIQGFGSFRGQTVTDLSNYLKAILRNNLQDARRRHISAGKRSLQRESHAADLDHQADSVSLSPSRIVERRDELQQLKERLSQLPDKQQELLRLFYWEQLNFVEIGARIGKSPDAVRKAFWKAIQTLTHAVHCGAIEQA